MLALTLRLTFAIYAQALFAHCHPLISCLLVLVLRVVQLYHSTNDKRFVCSYSLSLMCLFSTTVTVQVLGSARTVSEICNLLLVGFHTTSLTTVKATTVRWQDGVGHNKPSDIGSSLYVLWTVLASSTAHGDSMVHHLPSKSCSVNSHSSG